MSGQTLKGFFSVENVHTRRTLQKTPCMALQILERKVDGGGASGTLCTGCKLDISLLPDFSTFPSSEEGKLRIISYLHWQQNQIYISAIFSNAFFP